MDFPSEERMVAALVQAAMVDSLEKQITITNVAGFKHTVERRLHEGEAAHPGYLKLAYRAMAKRLAGDPDADLPNRPPPVDDVLDEDPDYEVATPEEAARWKRVIDCLFTLKGQPDHSFREAVRTHCPAPLDERGYPIKRDEDDMRQVLTYLEALIVDHDLKPTTGPVQLFAS